MQPETQQQIEQHHLRAMEYTDEACAARRRGDEASATQYFGLAFHAESEAAEALFSERDLEPTRSILYRSAGYLALDAGETREAERMAAAGLAGNPPAEIAEQLRDLVERVNFQRHLDLRGIELASSEIQLSLAGNAVSFGTVEQSTLSRRVESTEKMTQRIAERLGKRPYDERISKSAKEQLRVYTSVPRAASYAVTLRFGGGALALPGLDGREDTITELFRCLDLFRQDDEKELRNVIADEAYFTNFIGLARLIEPDGVNLSTVGFTTLIEGKEQRVNLSVWDQSVKQSTIRRNPNPTRRVGVKQPEIVVWTGLLKYADAKRSETSKVQILTEENNYLTVSVPAGMMSDVVSQFWDTQVKITGRKKRNIIELDDIEAVTS